MTTGAASGSRDRPGLGGQWPPALVEAMGGNTVADEPGVSLLRSAIRRLRRSPSAIIGAAIVLAFVLVALLAPVLAPYPPASTQWISQVTPSSVPGPSPGHRLGLDPFGSDLLTQLIYGARQSLLIGVVSTGLGLVFGALLGGLAGAFGG